MNESLKAKVVDAANEEDGPRISLRSGMKDLLGWLRWNNGGHIEADSGDPEDQPDDIDEVWDEIRSNLDVPTESTPRIVRGRLVR